MTNDVTDVELDTTQPETPEPLSTGQAQGQPRSLRTHLSWFDKTFRNVWFYVAAILLVVNLTYNFRPQLTIQSASPIDNPLAAWFTITNNGPWTLYEVGFFCDVNGTVSSGNLVSRGPDAAPEGDIPIDVFPSGQTATRDCAAVTNHIPPDDVRIDLLITYKWLWGMTQGHLTRHFDTRRVQRHVILVPDVEPGVLPSFPRGH